MKKISLALALCCASFYSMADQLPLGDLVTDRWKHRPVKSGSRLRTWL